MKEIIIKKIENRKDYFLAYFKKPMLEVTFSVCFTDSITGAIALNEFFQMLKFKYSKESFEFVISDETVKIKNECLLNQIKKEEAIK
jgi:hypothetical protein